ncbi:methionine--tRNA ligase subunit beta [Granulicella mallensis]|uniref:Methionine--tRNA ligase n=1 Tax=Granulicella mallensis TaxID=940614 RepID=A0A7W7ZKP3_9BACT|nr:methionine--tRNA ligase subunit beta [Granulicella mallensis]MBB5061725.1 methionyl-tRNA synthetase [Granulicella mallensis]
MSANRKKFYLTTPIYYVNARPHIGHAYTTIVADVLARRHRLLGDDTFFLTGTDEHGQKIERSAAVAGIAPQQFADQVSIQFRNLWDRMGLTYDRYIRTTDAKHKRGAQKLFADLYERGQIYLSSYTGQYSVGEEIFVEGPPGTIGPDGKPTETVTEENFFFRLSEYQRPLLDLIESDTLAITPEARKNEVLSFLRGNVVEGRAAGLEIENSNAGAPYVKGALRDLSVSRSSFTWGIPVPEPAASATDKKHVMYVWLDALANYMTAIGYGSDDPKDITEFNHYWPADVHIMAKEITRQHCIYWPAFLLAADLPLPKAVTAHGWLLFDNSKMSKSKGNIVRTETILDAFGDEVYGKQFPDSTKAERDLFASDVLRYFLLREIPFGQDGSFSFDALITRYNADLANGYGNLVSRTLNMIGQFCDARIPQPENTEFPSDFSDTWNLILQNEDELESFDFASGLNRAARKIAALDGLLTSNAPWKLAKSDSNDDIRFLQQFLYAVADSIRVITAQLYPILPSTTAKVWKQFGFEKSIEQAAADGELNNLQRGGLKPGTKLGPLAPIFPRADKGLVQIMTDMENPTPTETRPEAPLKAAATPAPAQPVPTDSTHPAAAPRTSSLGEPSGSLPVGGSGSTTTHNGPTPSHTDAPASGPFASVASQTPITAGPADAAPTITIDDFAKIELRVAQILVAERIPKADKLLRLEVDLGHEKRQILSGIAEWYTPEDLIGRRIVVITNLAPRKMRGLESHGMLLAASEGEGGKPVLATFGEEIALGSRLK